MNERGHHVNIGELILAKGCREELPDRLCGAGRPWKGRKGRLQILDQVERLANEEKTGASVPHPRGCHALVDEPLETILLLI